MRIFTWLALAALAACSSKQADVMDSGTPDVGVEAAPAAQFTISASPTTVLVKPGGTATVTITAVKQSDFTGTIDVSFAPLPVGVTTGTNTIPIDGNEVIVTLTGAGSVESTVKTATVTGTSANETATTTIKVVTPGTNGELDQTFGVNGVATTTDGDGYAVSNGCTDGRASLAQQSDGSLLAAVTVVQGSNNFIQVVRFTPDGVLDSTFGTAGRTDFTKLPGFGGGIALQSDGKIIVGGSVSGKMLVARFDTDGTLDLNFGAGGVATASHTATDTMDCGHNVAIRSSDGEVLVSGIGTEASKSDLMVVAAFKSNGSRDMSYGTTADHFAAWGMPGSSGGDADAHGMVTDASGYTYLGGSGVDSSVEYEVVLEMDATGHLGNWGQSSSGAYVTSNETKLGINGMVLLSGGKIATVGTQSGAGARIDEFDSTGNPYVQFALSGSLPITVSTKPNAIDETDAITVQQDGRLVIAGQRSDGFDAYIVRLDSTNYMPDTGFGTGGRIDNAFGAAVNPSIATALGVAADGRVIIGGLGSINGGKGALYLTRIWP